MQKQNGDDEMPGYKRRTQLKAKKNTSRHAIGHNHTIR